MTFATALKISITCLAALAAEAVLAYYLFLNFAYELADSGQYSSTAEAYAAGPMGTLATMFYGVFAATAAAGLLAPLVAAVSWIARGRPPQPSRDADVLPPKRPR
jgi:hypothetical protein